VAPLGGDQIRKKCDEPAKMRREGCRRGAHIAARPVARGCGYEKLKPSPPMKLHRSLITLTFFSIIGPILGADVLANWKEHCAKCHGDDGKGDTKMGRKLSIADLTDPAVQAKFKDEDAIKAMKEGVNDKAGKVAMKPIENLAADDMPALVKFVRGLKK
jgi:hypothetical protein